MKKEFYLLIFIILLSTLFRFYKLNSIPPGLYPDVAINGNDALDSLEKRDFKVFYPENNGREGAFIWLISLSFLIFGPSIFSIKIVAATIGILTVFGLYLLAHLLFEDKKISLLASFFLGISFWHVNFSRIGFRAILLPFVLVFSFYFLIKGLKQKKFLETFLSAIFFGLGFYTYTSFRMSILILPFVFIPYFFIFKKENDLKKFFFLIISFSLIVILIFLPLAVYFFKNPEYFAYRFQPISVFSAQNPFKEFLKSFILHLGMFNFYGDGNWRHNISGSPLLFWPIGIFFLVGFFLSLLKFFNLKKIFPYSFLIIWFFVMLLPGILTREGIPHALRTLGAIPPVFIFSAFGADFLWKKFSIFLKKYRTLFLIFLFIFLVFGEYFRYFILWGENEKVKDAFSEDLLKEGEFLNSLPEETKKYVIVNLSGVPVPYPSGLPMPSQTLIFSERTKYKRVRSIYLKKEELERIKIEGKTIILPMVFEKEIFKDLKEKFPQGKAKKMNNFIIFEITH